MSLRGSCTLSKLMKQIQRQHKEAELLRCSDVIGNESAESSETLETGMRLKPPPSEGGKLPVTN